MDALTLGPIKSLSGEVRLPGSKSISNRALLLAALARGRTRILNLLDSEDTELMRRALNALGIAVTQDRDAWVVEGGGPLVTDGRCVELNLGLAGTAMRPLVAALTLGNGEFVLDGTPRMRERPIGPLVDALRALGADLD
ncbi:MAG: 3-phosphoshikimate 1-carboxyvinyltransferase, partial [Gammaproteobacteria bacterium]|nr:3-phosphoshikimate 1-carboxyvinyltransferase [Gammaproteobacteria bacterium]